MGRKWESTAEITAWDPPNEYGQKSTGGSFPFEVRIKFEPHEGGTLLKAHITGEVQGWLKLAGGLLMKQLEKQIESNFEALKQVLEAG